LRTSTDAKQLLDAWRAWHSIAVPIRPLFQNYLQLGNKGARELGEVGFGKTINMSSNGVLFTTDQYLLPGRRLELSISWPAQLNSTVALKLVARGRVVRCEENKAAIEIHQYEFRTASQASITVQ
jgi:hypothetical protein